MRNIGEKKLLSNYLFYKIHIIFHTINAYTFHNVQANNSMLHRTYEGYLGYTANLLNEQAQWGRFQTHFPCCLIHQLLFSVELVL